MEQKFFTVAQARHLLPFLKKLVGPMVTIAERLQQYQEAAQKLTGSSANNTGSPDGTAYVESLILLQSYLSEIQKTGCLVKSVQEGLVDFPHLKDGREVYLCWKYGEDDIEYWHEVDAGFAGRTPLLE